jgi:transcriptional regulator with XRE-family HTH domain
MESLKKAREAIGITKRREAAKLIGLHIDQLRAYENGKHRPSIEILREMAKKYGLTLGQLCGDEPLPQEVADGQPVAV